MNRARSTRRALVFWSGWTLTALCGALYATGALRRVTCRFGSLEVTLERGGLSVQPLRSHDIPWRWVESEATFRPPRVIGIEAGPAYGGWIWLPRIGPSFYPYARLPIWPLAIPSLAAAVCASIRRNAAKQGCPCGYDLTGLPAGSPCPECGRTRA